MSKKIVYFVMLAFSLTIFAGCSDDDDDDNVIDYAIDVQGTYAGTLNLQLPEMEQPIPTEKNIALKRTDVNKIQVSLAEIQVPTGVGEPLTVAGIEVKDIPVTKSGDTYTLTETTQTISVTIASLPVPGIKVTVSGTIKNNKLESNIKVAVPAIMENPAMEIPVTFSGDRINK